MSLTYDIGNIDCGLPIYETVNEQMWIDCNSASNRRGAWIFTAILIVITILIIFFAESTLFKIVFALGAVAIIGGIIAGTYFYMPGYLSREWKQYEKRLDTIQEQLKVDRPGAIREYVRREEEKRKIEAAEMTARGTRNMGNAQAANAARGWSGKL